MKPVVIIGLGACYGPHQHVDSFAQAVYAGRPLSVDSAGGGGVAGILGRAAESALLDAQLPQGLRILLMTSGGPAVGSVQPELVQRYPQWSIRASDRGVSAHSTTGLGSTLTEASAVLADGQADAVLVLDTEPQGAGAMVLSLHAETQRNLGYAVMESVGLAPETVSACGSAFTSAGVQSGDVAYVEMQALPEAKDASAFGSFGPPLSCAFGTGASSPMAALIKAVMCLRWRMLPPLPEGQAPVSPSLWAGTPFYVPAQAVPWFAPASGKRRAAVCFEELPDHICLLIADADPHRSTPAVRPKPDGATHYLLPIAGQSAAQLVAELRSLDDQLAMAPPLDGLAQERFAAYQRHMAGRYAVVLTGHNVTELQREVKFGLQAVPASFDSGQVWTSPRGSYFTPRPLGQAGLAFVYPGAFNAYVGLGRDLFLHFPGLHETLTGVVPDVGRSISERYLYPRASAPQGENDARAFMEQFAGDPAAMIETGILFAVAFTSVLGRNFGIRPRSALGYSLGEVSMLWAGGVWSSAEASSAAWQQSPLFRTRLFGPKEAVREAWGVKTGHQELWRTYLLKAPLAEVQACLAAESRVYLTMINLPNEVVIGGDPDACQRIISTLHCHALPILFDSVLHNAAMRSEQPALARLYSNPVNADSDVTYYSAAHYRPLTLERETLANDLARMTCELLDFPRLVEAAYAGGARLFVEMGPQATCTRWIDRLLEGRSHAAVAINRPRAGDYEGVLGVLAALVSHRVPVDLAPLFETADRSDREAGPDRELATQLETGRLAPPPVPQPKDQAHLLNESHAAFLETSHAQARHTAELIRLQTLAARNLVTPSAGLPRAHLSGHSEDGGAALVGRRARPAPVLDEPAIRAFTLGRAEACFGAAYAIYRGRRLPCLPNGDLQLVSRAVAVDGTPGKVEAGASLVSEYDVPRNAWFLRGRTALPYTAVLEMALQPCGLLSAYLGSTLPYPEVDFYFRNLDGSASLLREVDVQGQTVTNRVRLIATSAVHDMIIQQFEYELACGGEPFYVGTASFGYFTQQALAGRGRPPDAAARSALRPPTPDASWVPVSRPTGADGRLELLNQAWVSASGGQHERGFVFGAAAVRPSDWYFKCHFFQDPVMPGSLGVEAVRQAVEVFARRTDGWPSDRAAGFEPAVGPTMTWKYRGQMTPQDKRLLVEAHLREITAAPDRLTLVADARVWNGDAKIYEVDKIGVTARLKE